MWFQSAKRPTAAYPGNASTFLFQHRAMASLDNRAARIAGSAALSLVLTVILVAALPYIGAAWGHLSVWLSQLLGFGDTLVMSTYVRNERIWFQVPYFAVTAAPLTETIWTLSLAAIIVLFAGSFMLPERFTPLRYAVRALVIIQSTAVLYFAVTPETFPYSAPAYLRGMMTAGLFVIVLVPFILGITFYLLDFFLYQKVGLTVLITGYLAVAVPLQYAVQAVILKAGSLLFLPMLYLVFGLPVNVFVFIAFYAWGMSWTGKRRRPRTLPLSKTAGDLFLLPTNVSRAA